MKRYLKQYGKYAWRICFFCLLTLISMVRVKGIDIPASSMKEIPYWDLILRLAGQEGIVDIAQTSHVYAFGYCLPFAVLLRAGLPLLTVYKMAVFINGLFMAVLYILAAFICEKMTSSNLCSLRREGMVSFLCILPIFIAQSSIMGEQMILAIIILSEIAWITIFNEGSVCSKKLMTGLWGIGIVGMIISPLFFGVILANIIYFYIETGGFKQNRRGWISLLIALSIGILLVECLEYALLVNLQVSRNEWNYSGLHSLFHMIAAGRRTSGLLGLLFGLIGKFMYLITNSFGIVMIGLYSIVNRKKEGESFKTMTGLIAFNILFLVLAIYRTDSACGLPTDALLSMVMMPVLLVAGTALLTQGVRIKDMVYSIAVILVTGCLSRDVWEILETETIDWAATGMLALGRDFCRDVFENSILTTAVAALVLLIILIANYYGDIVKIEIQSRFMKYYTGFFRSVMHGIVIFFCLTAARYYVFDILDYAQDKIRFSYEIPSDYLENTEHPIIYYKDDSKGEEIAFARLLSMNGQKVIYTKSLDKALLEENALLLVTEYQEELPTEIIDNYEMVYGTDRLSAWEKKGMTKQDTLKHALINSTVKLVKVNSTDYTFVEYGKEYILPKGIYEIKVKYNILTNKKGKLGRIAVRSGAKTLESITINGLGERMTDTIKLRIESVENLMNFRVAIHKKRSVDIKEEWVYLTKVGDINEQEK